MSRSHEGQGQIFIVQCEGLVTRVNVCEYEQNPSRDEKVTDKIKNPRSRSHEGQGQIYIVQCEGLVTRVNVCECEQNPSRDEKVMDKIKNFSQFVYVQGQGHMNVQVKYL